MTIYPLEFYRRAEEKWRHRSEPMMGSERPSRTARAISHQTAPVRNDDILVRRPWLRAIGQGLEAEYDAFEQSVPEPLAALLRELGRAPTRGMPTARTS
jgi:hypothetical protein